VSLSSVSHEDSSPRRLAFVGLGRAAGLSLAALDDRDDIVIVGGVDPRGVEAMTRLPSTAPVVGRSEELPSFDIAIVATPTPSHVEDCRRLFGHCEGGELILCEKPLALVSGEAEALFADARSAGVELRVLLHYAYAPEVLWARRRLGIEPPVESFAAYFRDPYGEGLFERAAVLGTSWVDLGVNALSVLERLVTLETADPLRSSIQLGVVRVGFSAAGGMGEGTIMTAWGDGDPVKRTSLRLRDGPRVDLDHVRGSVSVDGRELYRSRGQPISERYRTMLAAHLDGSELVHTNAATIDLHRVLAAGDIGR